MKAGAVEFLIDRVNDVVLIDAMGRPSNGVVPHWTVSWTCAC